MIMVRWCLEFDRFVLIFCLYYVEVLVVGSCDVCVFCNFVIFYWECWDYSLS